MTWTFPSLWHHLAAGVPTRIALRHNTASWTWRQFDDDANALAHALRAAGVHRGDTVAMCLSNHPHTLITWAAALRLGAAPAGVNPRYRTPELRLLLERLHPAAVIFDGTSAAALARLPAHLPQTRLWCRAGAPDPRDRASGPDGPTAPTITDLLAAHRHHPTLLDSRADDVLIKCTGGTTGTPVPIQWRAGEVLTHLNEHNPWHRHDLTQPPSLLPVPPPHRQNRPARLLVASPLCHGSGLTRALGALSAAGTVITLPGPSFDPAHTVSVLAQTRADTLALIGDAFALPLLQALDAEPSRRHLPDLQVITSSGAAWSHDLKHRLLEHLPHLRLVETLGASEATGLGSCVSTRERIPATGHFHLGAHAQIITPDGRAAGPGDTGFLAVRQPLPLNTPHRYVQLNGVRYLISGDQARLLSGREFVLLGREQDVINSGGEKAYGPEIRDALRADPAIADALVVPLPHPRFGTVVGALIQLRTSPHPTSDPSLPPEPRPEDLLRTMRQDLAAFKIPTRIQVVDVIPHTPAGKPDRGRAIALLTGEQTPTLRDTNPLISPS
jgi:acyl-CoA synthetase (AMP-forming)/AMP-acid ligase II